MLSDSVGFVGSIHPTIHPRGGKADGISGHGAEVKISVVLSVA